MLTTLSTVCPRRTLCNHLYSLENEDLDKDAYVALPFGEGGFFFFKQAGCTYLYGSGSSRTLVALLI